MYTVWLDLRKPAHLRIAERILGPLPDSCEVRKDPGFYIVRTSFDKILQTGERGIELDQVEWEKNPPKPDSLHNKKPWEKKSPDKESGLFYSLSGVSLEYVDGMTSPGILPAGRPITFYIRMNNTLGFSIEGLANGFRAYSSDGAQWGGLSADTLSVGLGGMLDFMFPIMVYGADGIGADTAGFFGFKIDSAKPACLNSARTFHR